MDPRLKEAAAVDNVRKRNDAFKKILAEYVEQNSEDKLCKFVDFMIEREDKAMLTECAQKSMSLGDARTQEEFSMYAIKRLEQLVGFDGEAGEFRKGLALLLEDLGRIKEAAVCLSKIKLDGSGNIADAEKMQINLKIAMLYLVKKDDISAEAYLTRANMYLGAIKDPVLLNYFKEQQARVLDLQSRFMEAFHKYYALSQEVFLDAEKLNVLSSALICAVLANAGPSRSRALTTLYKDESSTRLAAYSMLEKMHLGRIVRSSDIEVFESGLEDHHRMQTRTEGTLLERAVREHNVLACSNIYKNISFEQLGSLLGVSKSEAEEITAKMIMEDRLAGFIDQSEGMLIFSEKETLEAWDKGIELVCNELNWILEGVNKKQFEK